MTERCRITANIPLNTPVSFLKTSHFLEIDQRFDHQNCTAKLGLILFPHTEVLNFLKRHTRLIVEAESSWSIFS